MSPVFGHGRLRLYLLKLLEESPRHGYEVIRLLQDRFLGVYSPSPGTIYPRLARLEEEGLVTHEVIDGKKVFSLTDQGRAELNERLDELAELEQEISASVQDIAREVKEDVRSTVRSLREELAQAAKNVRSSGTSQWTRWQDESDRWSREWRRIWTDAWSTLGGGYDDDAEERAQLDADLGELLADFVARVRQDASAGRLTRRSLEEARRALDEAAARIGDTLR
ncbi:helix-turn-helix transcriptional regulator [Nonomuraea sp. NPDC050310]|uniref:PadR family transcriptional regulator n=1 Tax=unclassified Nonomuraea TaxID=2593643 RepID=UPI0033E3B2EE